MKQCANQVQKLAEEFSEMKPVDLAVGPLQEYW
jgi:hypothetical protein